MLAISIQRGRPNGQRKRVFASLFPSEFGGPRDFVRIPSLNASSPLCFLDCEVYSSCHCGKYRVPHSAIEVAAF